MKLILLLFHFLFSSALSRILETNAPTSASTPTQEPTTNDVTTTSPPCLGHNCNIKKSYSKVQTTAPPAQIPVTYVSPNNKENSKKNNNIFKASTVHPIPTSSPTSGTTFMPTYDPTRETTFTTTYDRTSETTFAPTSKPTYDPTRETTFTTTYDRTSETTFAPTSKPTYDSTRQSYGSSYSPTHAPSTIWKVTTTQSPCLGHNCHTRQPYFKFQTTAPPWPTKAPVTSAHWQTQTTSQPTYHPIASSRPTDTPTHLQTTSQPAYHPSSRPTDSPTHWQTTSQPIYHPSSRRTDSPTRRPTDEPTYHPSHVSSTSRNMQQQYHHQQQHQQQQQQQQQQRLQQTQQFDPIDQFLFGAQQIIEGCRRGKQQFCDMLNNAQMQGPPGSGQAANMYYPPQYGGMQQQPVQPQPQPQGPWPQQQQQWQAQQPQWQQSQQPPPLSQFMQPFFGRNNQNGY